MALDRGTTRMIILAVGIVVAGWAAGAGFARARLGDRFVTVKGFSEREVRADLAIWPLRVVASGNDYGDGAVSAPACISTACG